MSEWNCSNCSHAGAETTHDVACCNCCDDGEFYDEIEEEEVENGKGFFICRVCGALTSGDGVCPNCGEDPDPFHENDPYVVTHPMAFY